ncbi:MAG: ABC-2 type transport system permease protein, partial [Thermoproteota archaeon]
FSLLLVIEFIISSSMFYFIEGIGINFFRMQMQNISRWPDFIFGPLTKRMFTLFIPVLIIGSHPVKFLLDNSQWMKLVELCLAILVTSGVLAIIWPIALKKYESASS